jgi:N-methylhydantoinase B
VAAERQRRPGNKRSTDPITFEVVRSSLQSVAEEMSVSLQRSAFSTNVKTRLDYSCAIFDAGCRLVAQAFSQPAHLGIQAYVTRKAVAEYGPKNVGPGDVLAVNDPHRGGSHLNDIFLITPAFRDGRLVGWAGSSAHHVDVGGGAPGSLGSFTEVFQEGICFPVVKLVHAGEFQPDLIKFVLANIRSAREVKGDLAAQVASNAVGVKRILELIERFGLDELLSYTDELIRYSGRRTRAEIARLPDGVYSATEWLDDDGVTAERLNLQVTVTKAADKIRFDFSGTDAQRRGPMNATTSITSTGCYYALKCLIDPDIPLNQGFYDCVEIIIPTGTCLSATWPSACVGCWELVARIPDMVFTALSPALPELMPACGKSMICNLGFGGLDPRTGDYYTFMETVGGGYGGRSSSDGPDAIQTHIQNTQNAPIEETEINYPVRIVRYSLVEDSEGAGRFRGGLGLRRDYEFPDHEPSFTLLADRRLSVPWGLFGGLSGKAARYLLLRDNEEIELPSKTTFVVSPGEVVSVQTCGGGGYGHPHDREPALVARDIVEGKIDRARAESVYGIAFDAAGNTADPDGSVRRRNAKPAAQAARRLPDASR